MHFFFSIVPDIVWNINSLSADEVKQLSVSLDSREEERWWEYVDLTKLVLASNTLRHISPEISNYPALTVLDVSNIFFKNCIFQLLYFFFLKCA